MEFGEAAEALAAASTAPEPAQAPEPVAQPGTSQPDVTPEGTPSPEGTTAEQADSFTRTDLNSLLEGVTDPAARDRIEAAYRSFQGDYTRKMQTISEQAKAYEGIDVERARASLQFVDALENDPDFAVQVHQELSKALRAQGYDAATASAAAHEAISDSLGGDDFGDPQTSALAKELQELKEWKSGFERQREEDALAARIERQELAIRQANPDLQQHDIDAIYALAFSPQHAGNLDSAFQAYSSWKNDVIAGYLNAKAEVPSAPLPATAHSEEPTEAPADWDTARQGAREYLNRVLAGE